MPHINDKIEDVKGLLGGLTKDLQEVLTMVQLTIPTVEGTVVDIVRKAKKRINEIEKIIGTEEANGGRDAELRGDDSQEHA